MLKKSLKIVSTIFILSAVLLISGFEGIQSAQAKRNTGSGEMRTDSESTEHENCPEICYSPHLEADEYYIGHLNPKKYDEWAEQYDDGVVYNPKLNREKLLEPDHSEKGDETHSTES